VSFLPAATLKRYGAGMMYQNASEVESTVDNKQTETDVQRLFAAMRGL
jgi:hypothetical protein